MNKLKTEYIEPQLRSRGFLRLMIEAQNDGLLEFILLHLPSDWKTEDDSQLVDVLNNAYDRYNVYLLEQLKKLDEVKNGSGRTQETTRCCL